MTPEVKQEKQARLNAALTKLNELYQAEPNADPGAHLKAAAMHLTTTFGIARPLSDRYVAQAAEVRSKPDPIFEEANFQRITDLDDRHGAALMVVAHHMEQILKGGKHMSRRFRKWGDEGDTFRVKGKAFRFTKVVQMRVGDITDDDIHKEGYTNREEFEQMWVKSHPKAVAAGKALEPDGLCWSHEYEPV